MIEKLINLLEMDRRIIYVLIAVVVILPLVFPLGLPTTVSKPVKDVYKKVDKVKPNSKPILISFDYNPSTAPELDPMAYAILRHCFTNDIKVILMTLRPQGTGMIQAALDDILSEFPDKVSGKDYTFLGYVPGMAAVIMKLGQDIPGTFESDAYGHDVSKLPMMKNIKTYDDIPLVIDISGSSTPLTWMIYANAVYKQKIAVGTTAVSAAEYYPYLQTNQFVGMLGGLKGAAEYEELNTRNDTYKNYYKNYCENNPDDPFCKSKDKAPRRTASIGMDAQSLVHLLIMVLILLGNSIFFLKEDKKK